LIDSYEKFLTQYVSKEDFFEFGLKETIYIPFDKVEKEWKNLKNRIYQNQTVFIRGFGRDAAGTHLFLNFYEKVFQNNQVVKDPTNNQQPTKLLENLTGLKKNKDIRNYQVSHIFGKTKNVFAFTAPWNIVFMPKLLDPFTGHEAKGKMIDEYQKLFQQQSYDKFKIFIDEFNDIVTDVKLTQSIEDYFAEMQDVHTNIKLVEKFKKAVYEEFAPIDLNA